MKEVDVFVIGSGGAGRTVAKCCVKAGLKVAISDNREYGGTCATRGCDPKKVLLGPTEVCEMASNLLGKGISRPPELNWLDLQRFKLEFTKNVPQSTEKDLRELGIQLFHESPRFISSDTLEVENSKIKAGKIVIATGYVPRLLNVKGAEFLNISDDFLNLKNLPEEIVFIGGGYIGMEFSHMAARAGSKVTIIEHGSRILSSFDKDMTRYLTNVTQDLGIRIVLNAEVIKIENVSNAYNVEFKQSDKVNIINTSMVFNTSGREPSIAMLNLEKANVNFSEQGIVVNEFLQNTSNPRVYACGDVSEHGLPLTPISAIQGEVVAHNILNGNSKKVNTPVVPSAVFTLPNLASVGLSEDEARRKYNNVSVSYNSVQDWFSAKRINSPAYTFKVIWNNSTKLILGAHLLGSNAAETINIFAMAINHDITIDKLKNTIFTYPSWINDIKSMI